MNSCSRPLTSFPGRTASTLRLVAAYQPEQARRYVELLTRVEVYLERHTGSRAWAGLDVAAFVDAHASTRRQRVEICCNLSAMLACVAGSDDLSREDARRLWTALAGVCPDDPAAQCYLALGIAEFTGGLDVRS